MKKEREPGQTFTDDQKRAIRTLGRNLCVSAGAGSGKTTVLVERFLYLIEGGNLRVDEIVAITFTEKAANQLKEKIRKKFRERMDHAETPEERSRWEKRYRRAGAAWIHTIHGLCTRILREQAVTAKIDPGFFTLDETETLLLLEKTLGTFIVHRLDHQEESMVRLLSAYGLERTRRFLTALVQKRAVTLPWIATCLKQSDEEILRPLFEARRDGERKIRSLAGRLRNRSASDPADKMEQNRRHALAAIPAGDFQARDLAELTAIRLSGGSRKKWPSPDDLNRVRDLLKEIREEAKALLPLFNEEALRLETELLRAFCRELEPLFEAYQKDKASLGVLDFEDLQILTRDLLRKETGVREHYRKTFATILVDEHQDTDPLQMEIIELLAGDEEGRLFVVGDDQQSIYGFRGADVTVFRDHREKTMRNNPENRVSLHKNFRSQGEILRFINHLFWGIFETFEGLDAHRGSLDNRHFVESRLVAVPGEEKRSAEKIRQEEAAAIAQRISVMVRKGEKRILSGTGQPEAVQYGDIALLFRAMTDVKIYERALLQAGIPFTVISGDGFFRKQEVTDVVSLLRLLHDPEDDEALAALLRSPAAGVRDETLYFMTRGHSLSAGLAAAETLDGLREEEREILLRTRRILEDLRGVKNRVRIPELIGRFLDRTGYGAVLLSDPVYGRQRHANLRKLMDMARKFSTRPFFGLPDFIHYLNELKEREVREGESPVEEEGEDTVKILSIHRAKGLEFPVVFLPDLGRNPKNGTKEIEIEPTLGIGLKIPDGKGGYTRGFLLRQIGKIRKQKEIEEGKRLFYVAATRARDFLLLSGQVRDPKTPDREASIPMEWLCDRLGITEANCGEEIAYGDRTMIPFPAPPDGTVGEEKPLRWIDRYPDLPSGAFPDLAGETIHPQFARQVFNVPEHRAGRRYTISQLLKYQQCPKGYELSQCFGIAEPRVHRESASTGGGGRKWGSLIHRILQQWDLDSGSLPAVLNRELARAGYTAPEQERLRPRIVQLLEGFARSETAERIRRAREVHAEIPFLLNLQGYRIEGVIDRLYRSAEGRLMILDYKTDGISANDIGTKAAEYRFQLAGYALAAHRLFGEEVETALAFLQPGITCPVDHDPSRTEEEILSTIRKIEKADTYPGVRERCPHCGFREPFCSREKTGKKEKP